MLPLLFLLLAFTAWGLAGWGPGNHLEFAERVLRRRRENFSPGLVKLFDKERSAYLYGNLAADIINFKAYGGHKNHCHRWTIVDAMRERAESPAEEAFILGYLSHLAADTIAHNHFVPYHLARYARTRSFGHLYWEMNADRYVPESRWDRVAQLKEDDSLARLDELINSTVPKKAFSMRTNKLLFNHVLLVSAGERYRRGIARLHPIKHVALERGFLEHFRVAAVERVRLALKPRGLERLLHIDPSGKAAQRKALKERTTILRTWRSADARRRESEEAAAVFLEGMESPPAGSGEPLWS